MDDNNPLKNWLTAHYDITQNDDDLVSASALKRAYMLDCSSNGVSDNWFAAMMAFNSVGKRRTRTGMMYVGLRRKDGIDDAELS